MARSTHDGLLAEREKDLAAQIARLAGRFEEKFARAANDVTVHPSVFDEIAAAVKLPDELTLVAHKRVMPNCILVGGPPPKERSIKVAPKVHEPVEPGPCPECQSEETRRKGSTRLQSGDRSCQFYCKACGHRWREHVTPTGERKPVAGKAAA